MVRLNLNPNATNTGSIEEVNTDIPIVSVGSKPSG